MVSFQDRIDLRFAVARVDREAAGKPFEHHPSLLARVGNFGEPIVFNEVTQDFALSYFTIRLVGYPGQIGGEHRLVDAPQRIEVEPIPVRVTVDTHGEKIRLF